VKKVTRVGPINRDVAARFFYQWEKDEKGSTYLRVSNTRAEGGRGKRVSRAGKKANAASGKRKISLVKKWLNSYG